MTLSCKDIAPLSVGLMTWTRRPCASVNCLALLLRAPLLSGWAIFNGHFSYLINFFGGEKNNGLDFDRSASGGG
jgi:hypothetical protein